jgi:hypothetical protein
MLLISTGVMRWRQPISTALVTPAPIRPPLRPAATARARVGPAAQTEVRIAAPPWIRSSEYARTVPAMQISVTPRSTAANGHRRPHSRL